MISVSRPSPSQSMGAGVSESRGARHAALLLHAMSEEDRSWTLEALSDAERAHLLPLLAELETLGIERDPALIDEATTGASSVAMPEPNSATAARPPFPISDESMLHALDGHQVREVVACLRAEPVGLIAEWLRLVEWPWREDLLAALEPAQRRRVEGILLATGSGTQVPPGMRAALISAVAARWRERLAGEAPAAAPWHGLKQSLSRMFRGGSLRWSRGR